MTDWGDYEGFTDNRPWKRGPKLSPREDAEYQAERYRQALVSSHGQVEEMKKKNDVLVKHIAFLKRKRKEEAQQIRDLKQQIEKLHKYLNDSEQHLKFAAGELRVTLPPPGSEMAMVLRAYRNLRKENEELKDKLGELIRKVIKG